MTSKSSAGRCLPGINLPEQLKAWKAPAKVRSLAVSPDGKLLASGDTDGIISLWQAETGELVRRLEGHRETDCRIRWACLQPLGKTPGQWLL